MASVGKLPAPTAVEARIAATPLPQEPSRRSDREAHRASQDRADAARYYLTHPTRGFRDDCSGFVEAVYARAGAPVTGSTRTLWEQARDERATHQRHIPRPGDLAFFDNTYDRDGNGRRDDTLTHIAVVLEVDEEGTILLAHSGTSRGRTTLRMNLRSPNAHTNDQGEVINDYLRRRDVDEPSRSPRLAGQLWHGFASWDPAPPLTASRLPVNNSPRRDVPGGTAKEDS